MAELEEQLLNAWRRYPEVLKSLIEGDSLSITVKALQEAVDSEHWADVIKLMELLNLIVEDSYSQEE